MTRDEMRMMAVEFAQRHIRDLRYVPDRRLWVRWDVRLWRLEREREPFARVRALLAERGVHDADQFTVDEILELASDDPLLTASADEVFRR